MSSISSVDTSLYSDRIQEFYATSGKDAVSSIKEQSIDTDDINENKVDLSNYYSDKNIKNLLAYAGNNIVKSAEQLDNAMAQALKNGYTVNDVCNINKAKAAYLAECAILQSTFELST